MEERSMQKRTDRSTVKKPIVSIAVTEAPERQVYKRIFGCAHMSRVGKILEFSCRQPALCTGAQHQSRWVHILQPPLFRGPCRSPVHETARRDAPLPHRGGFRLYIAHVYHVHASRFAACIFNRELYFSSDLLSILFARPRIRCPPLVLRESQRRQLPHLVCWLPTRELLINSRLLFLVQLLHSLFPFLLRISSSLFSFIFTFVRIMDILAWIGTQYQAAVENCVLFLRLSVYARALWYLRIFN